MTTRLEQSESAPLDAQIVELALLLPRWQAEALADVASHRGMTAGQMLRRVIGEIVSAPTLSGNALSH